MEIVRRTRRTPVVVGAAALLLTACGGIDSEEARPDVTSDADTVSLWVLEEAISADGNAYELMLMSQPLPTTAPATDIGFVSFGLGPAKLSITNKVIDQATPGFDVDTYLFFDCDLLSAEPMSLSESGDVIISAAGWDDAPDRLVAVDGGYCVQRLEPVSVEEGLAPGADVTIDVGVDDLGFVVPEEQQGRIETMLGRPLFVQFGITEHTGSSFYTERSVLGAGATASSATPAAEELELASTEHPSDADLFDQAEVLDVGGELPAPDLAAVEGAEVEADAAPIATPSSTSCPTKESQRRRLFEDAPPMCIDPAADYTATVHTSVGDFSIELDAMTAPSTVNNFVVLSRYGFYDDTPCHRIITDFVAQCGDPTGTGLGGPGYVVDDELPQPGHYRIGSVAMANSGPDTNGSQWFVVTGEHGATLPPDYSLFGTVTDGLDDAVVWMNALGSASGTPQSEVRIESIVISTN